MEDFEREFERVITRATAGERKVGGNSTHGQDRAGGKVGDDRGQASNTPKRSRFELVRLDDIQIVAMSLMAATGFSASTISDVLAHRSRAVFTTTSIQHTVQRLADQRKAITETRSVAAIEAQLEIDRPLVARDVWRATKECHDVTIPDSVKACSAIMVNRQALAMARQRDVLDARLLAASTALNGAAITTSVDPQAEQVSKLLSWVTRGWIAPTPDDIALVRLLGLTIVRSLAGFVLTFVISKNLKRRHLNESQRAMVAARLATMKHGENQDPSGKFAARSNVRTQAAAAVLLNSGERTVRDARKVIQHGANELEHAIDRGEVSVSAAAEVTSQTIEEQRELVAAGGNELSAAASKIRAKKRQRKIPKGRPAHIARTGAPETSTEQAETTRPPDPLRGCLDSILNPVGNWTGPQSGSIPPFSST
jgi:hypothetical protein